MTNLTSLFSMPQQLFCFWRFQIS